MKNRVTLFVSVTQALLFLLSGCATTGKSVGVGAASGVGLGAAVGALANPGDKGENRIRNVLVGSAIGGAAGAGTGYLVDKYLRGEKDDAYQKGRKETQKEIADLSTSSDGRQPKLVPPRTEARWVGDHVRGSTFIPGHFEYIIIEGARWDASR